MEIFKEDLTFPTTSGAIASAISTFKRAQIDYVVITSNTPDEFAFRRPYHNHRGVKKGKKVGGVEIYRISEC